MSNRMHTPTTVETEVLTKSRRRCCICFGLEGDLTVKAGQIAHLDQNAANGTLDNLAWLCLEHHNEYDSSTRQSKNFTISEVKKYRQELYAVSPHMPAVIPAANRWMNDLQSFRAKLNITDWREEEAYKDVLLLPSPEGVSRLPLSKISQFIGQRSIGLEGYGGGSFPLPPYGDTNVLNRPNGCIAFRSGSRYRRDWTFDSWFMQTDGSFFARTSVDEDHDQSVHPQQYLRFSWTLLDIVRPLRFSDVLLREFPDIDEILIVFSWGGLRDRMLFNENWRMFDRIYVCNDTDVSLPGIITRDTDLQQMALGIATQLFWLFQWSREDDYMKNYIQQLFEGRMPK